MHHNPILKKLSLMVHLNNFPTPPHSLATFPAPIPAVHTLAASQHVDRSWTRLGTLCAPKLHACPATATYLLCLEKCWTCMMVEPRWSKVGKCWICWEKQQLIKGEIEGQSGKNDKESEMEDKSLPWHDGVRGVHREMQRTVTLTKWQTENNFCYLILILMWYVCAQEI